MRNRISNILWGLFFVAIGIGIAGNVLNVWDFNLFFDGWWTFFIIIPCFISMIQSNFGVGSTIGFIIGVLLFLNYQIDFRINMWRLIVPGILIFIGLRIMFQSAFRKKPNFYQQTNADGVSGAGYNTSSYSGAARQDYSAIFSGNRIHISDVFTGANLNAIFGGLTLDLREAKIPGDIEITASAVFGGIDIYIPAGVKVKVSNVPIFGGVSDKSQHTTDPGAPTIYLNSTCMFGGIDIK